MDEPEDLTRDGYFAWARSTLACAWREGRGDEVLDAVIAYFEWIAGDPGLQVDILEDLEDRFRISTKWGRDLEELARRFDTRREDFLGSNPPPSAIDFWAVEGFRIDHALMYWTKVEEGAGDDGVGSTLFDQIVETPQYWRDVDAFVSRWGEDAREALFDRINVTNFQHSEPALLASVGDYLRRRDGYARLMRVLEHESTTRP